jgi:hypothetical protein
MACSGTALAYFLKTCQNGEMLWSRPPLSADESYRLAACVAQGEVKANVVLSPSLNLAPRQ